MMPPTTVIENPRFNYRLVPVSPLVILLSKVDLAGNVIVKPMEQKINELGYEGLYKFLLLLNKVNEQDFGTAILQFRQLPKIELKDELAIPKTFQAQFSFETLQKTLLEFLKAWYNASLESRNVGKLKGLTQWTDKGQMRPDSGFSLVQHPQGTVFLDATTMNKKTKQLEDLITRVKELASEIQQCTDDQCRASAAQKIQTLLV